MSSETLGTAGRIAESGGVVACGGAMARSNGFAVLTALAPLTVLITGVLIINGLVGSDLHMRVSDVELGPVADAIGRTKGALSLADFAGRLRLSGPQTLLIAMSVVAIVASAATIVAVLTAHQPRVAQRTFLGICGLIGVVFALYVGWRYTVFDVARTTAVQNSVAGPQGLDLFFWTTIRDFYVYVVPEKLRLIGYGDAIAITTQMEQHGRIGGTLGVLAAAFLVAAAAVLAVRWRGDSSWRQPDTLRRQMTALLVLFALASILLVVSNAAVRAMVEWPQAIFAGEMTKDMSPVQQRFLETLRSATAALSTWWGMLSSAILLATFVPTFVSLGRDVDEAARLDLGRDATWAAVVAWKKEHGLQLSTGEITTAILAAAAPILTSPIIDLTKLSVLPG